MRVVFMGTPQFAVEPLRALTAEHEVVAVYTRHDRPAGRGLRSTASPIKEAAVAMGLAVMQPPSLRDPDAVQTLGALRPDVVCVVAFGLILPPEVLSIPPRGCLNVHASLLPRHRGAAPIERAILEGDETTGVSIMRMNEGLDTGPYARRVPVPVDDLDAESLRRALSSVGAAALVEVLREVEAGTVAWTPQSDVGATYASKLSAEDVALAPGLALEQALRRVRASGRSAPCRAVVNGRAVTVESASRAESPVPPGVAASVEGGLVLGLADGALRVDRLVPAGRASMNGSDYLRGARLGADSVWGAPS